MEITKEMFEQHSLHENFLNKLKHFHLANILSRVSLLVLSVFGLFLIPLNSMGSTPLTLLKQIFKASSLSIPALLITILPFFFALENIRILISLLIYKPKYVPSWYSYGLKGLVVYCFIKLAAPITCIFIVDSLAVRYLAYDFALWIALFILLGILNSITIFISGLLARKFVLTVTAELDQDNKKYNDKQINDLIKKNKKVFDTKAGIIDNNLSSTIISALIICFIFSIVSPITFNFTKKYNFPTTLGGNVLDIGIYISEEELNEIYENGSGTVVVNSGNCEIYTMKIEELENEIIEKKQIFYSLPSYAVTEEGIKKHKNEIKTLENEIYNYEKIIRKIEYQSIIMEVKCQKTEYNYYTEFSFIVNEIIYNTNSNDLSKKQVKKITLDKSNFYAKITNFSQEKITATVEYEDGSKRISYVKPDNLYELSIANAGQHMLKWSDSWGSYSYSITLS